jgi:ribosomal protein L12E/L44/L45/RPP1/RPP2
MARAMRRKAELNLDTAGMKSCSKSFLPLPDIVISSKLASVGVSLGSNNNAISVSANALRHMEFDRLKVNPKVSAKPCTSIQDDEELSATIDGQLLSHLVDEVAEVDLDELMLSSVYDLKASARKSKANSASKKSKFSSKVKSTKKTIVVQ